MNRISFLGVIVANGCNPNGDPVANNMPRQDYEGYGEISGDCLRRKLRDRLAEQGQSIFCQNANTANYDGYRSLAARAKATLPAKLTRDELRSIACEKWYDVRAFGQVLSFAAKKSDDGGGVSVGIRGPVSITIARSLDIIVPRCIELVTTALQSESQKGVLSFARRYVVDRAAYVFTGGISPQLASLTGFSDTDAEALHNALIHMFDNDASASRPEGSIVLHRLLWWTHSSPSGTVNPAALVRSVNIKPAREWPYYTLEFVQNYPGVSLDDYSM